MASTSPPRQRPSAPQPSAFRAERRTIDLPERFKSSDEDEADVSEPEYAHQPTDAAFMHQSVFGVIAAAHSKEDFNSIMDQDGSGEESQEEESPGPSTGAEKQKDSGSSRPAQKKRLSDHKLIISLPGVRHRSPKGDEPSTEPSPPASPSLSPPPVSRDAPIMSQMLQARANAENLESSGATLRPRPSTSASASTASLKGSRKALVALPEALKEIFQFDQPEEVISEYPCWYLANVLLQGYMYVTQRHVCFYAYLQQKSETTIKSGYIGKRGKTNPHFRRYWFVLKGTVLSYYTNPATPYFPSGNIDLRYGITADLVREKDNKDSYYFSVTTDKRVYQFKADSEASAKEWVRQLQKVIFRSHNDGDSVKISLPIDNILDVEENPIIDFAETIRIRVIDNDQTYAVDEYFFSFFSFGKDALNVLKIMTQDTTASKALADQDSSSKPPALKSPDPKRLSAALTVPDINDSVKATTSGTETHDGKPTVSPRARSFDEGGRSRAGSRASRASVSPSPRRENMIPRSPASSTIADESSSPSMNVESAESDPSGSRILSGSGVFRDPTLAASTTRRRFDNPNLQVAIRTSAASTSSSRSASPERTRLSSPQSPALHTDQAVRTSGPNTVPQSPQTALAEPRPSTSYTDSLGGFMRAGSYPIQRATDLLRDQGRRVSSLLGASPRGYYEKVYGMWAGGKKHYADADGLQGEDYVYDPDEESDTAQAEARFRDYFALPASEKLVAAYFAHILRVLPLYGKIYIGSTKLCFRSLLPGTRTKLVIPFKDILNVDKEKGFRFGYSGMVVVIKGHEEVFFEFNSAGLRDDCTVTTLKSLETLKLAPKTDTAVEGEKAEAERAAQEHIRLQEARQDGYQEHDIAMPRKFDELDRGAPPILFDDPQASLLDFKPPEPLAITCLTIGSRGDVQPYIALCKGLLKEGHKAKIATHAEFEPWIRKHGIDFAPVDGDPAELMRICVENGMFTPSFLIEANSKFRVFLDDLLNTAWTACQGSDLLIESPSAMAGIHIAEAMGIPYFRAFTMPWTRTRAYPHAFAVPNHKMGGAYNYMTYVLFDNVFWQSTAGQINRWRRKMLNLRPTNLDKLQPMRVPFLYNFSPSVVVPPLDFSDWIRVTGYWFLDEATTWTPPTGLVSFIAKARADKVPLVYIGFGSVVVSDSRALTQTILKAVQKADVRCILSKGWSDRLDPASRSEPEIPLPESIYPIASAPHDWLFAQIDAAVHHGGAGTTGASLRAGVPTIIRPFFGDQFFFGARVHDLGVGTCIRKISEHVLGKALWIATHDARMRDKAKLLGEQIRAEDGVATAIKALYRDLEYARTLVKRRARTRKRKEGAETGTESEEEEEEGESPKVADSWTLVGQDGESDAEGMNSPLRAGGARAG